MRKVFLAFVFCFASLAAAQTPCINCGGGSGGGGGATAFVSSGLMAKYLPYLDNTGTTLHDQSGNHFDCTLAGTQVPIWASPGLMFGSAAGTSYLSCPAGILSGAKTIMMIFTAQVPNTNEPTGSYPIAVFMDSNGWGVGTTNARGGALGLWHNSIEVAEPLDRELGFSSFAIVCNTPANFYVNGIAGTGSLNGGQNCPTFNGAGTATFANYPGGQIPGFQWAGTLYALLVYNQVLTAAQVYQNHQYATTLMQSLGASIPVTAQPPYALVFQGDSRTVNTGSSQQFTNSRPYYTTLGLGNRDQWWNLGVGGRTLAGIDGFFANIEYPLLRNFPSQGRTIYLDAGTNDMLANATGATVYTNMQTYCSTLHTNLPGVKIIAATSVARNDFTNAKEVQREALNTSIVSGMIAGTFNCDAVSDIANDPILATQTVPNGFNPSGSSSFNSTWFADGVHESAAANLEMSTQESFSIAAARGTTNGCTIINKRIPYQVIVAANTASAGTTQTVNLLQLFPGWQVCSLSTDTITAFVGTGVTGLTVSIGDSGTGGSATTYASAFSLTATGRQASIYPTFASVNGIAQLNFTSTGANLTALTAGEFDVQIGVVIKP